MAIGTNSCFHRRYWPAWLTLVLGLAVSGGLGWRLHRQAVELDRLRLQRIADVVLDRLHTKVQTTDLILRQAQDYFGSQESITASVFRVVSEVWLVHYSQLDARHSTVHQRECGRLAQRGAARPGRLD